MTHLFRQAASFSQFLTAYRRFLQTPMTLEEARAIIQARMADRGGSFLRMAATHIFQNPRSPYLPLMKYAGCELSDLISSVSDHGLEHTLQHLREAGVYFSFEEFKGRKKVIRGGREFPLEPSDFNNRELRSFYQGESGGSTGRPTTVFIDLAHISALAPAIMLSREGQGLLDQPCGMWLGVLPDPTGLHNLLRQAKWGRAPKKWFATPIARSATWQHRVFNQSIVSFGRAFGTPMPTPERLPLGKELVAARWIVENLASTGGGSFCCHPSKALRISLAAQEADLALDGVTFVMGGEPVTPGKIRGITNSGASYSPLYAFMEHGAVGEGCSHTRHGDEVHIFEDCLAITQAPRKVPGIDTTIDSFHFTSLLLSAPKILVNVESDDFGILEARSCDCELGSLGFRTFVRKIRSFSKLTGEGTTLVGSDLERVLEEDLPNRFGGSPLDYQLLEEEDEKMLTRLSLIIHPRIVIEDEAEVVTFLLDSLGPSTSILAEAGALTIKRMEPILTTRGKFLPLQLLGTSRRSS